MKIIGLTGGIGMGKSTVAKMLRAFGFPVWNADKAVHDALRPEGKGFAAVAARFPEAIKRGRIDRKVLGRIVFKDPRKLRQLEKILHPLVRDSERVFLQQARDKKARAVVLEIPLLFETGAEARCDITLCVTASSSIQKARVLPRPNMTEDKLLGILARQMPNAEKCKKADYTVPTGTSLITTREYLRKLLGDLLLLEPRRPSRPPPRRKTCVGRRPS